MERKAQRIGIAFADKGPKVQRLMTPLGTARLGAAPLQTSFDSYRREV
jgi:hypothetical protein